MSPSESPDASDGLLNLIYLVYLSLRKSKCVSGNVTLIPAFELMLV